MDPPVANDDAPTEPGEPPGDDAPMGAEEPDANPPEGPTLDSEGCPIQLEGFASIDAMGPRAPSCCHPKVRISNWLVDLFQRNPSTDNKDPHYADTGSLVARGNLYRNASGRQETRGTAFFNPRDFYDYSLDAAENVEALLARCAGPRPTLGL